MGVTITLPWPTKELQSNFRGHWAQKAIATKKARYEAEIVASAQKVGCWPNAILEIEYWPPTRRGDPQNVPHALKAYIDGIADAMGCDDKNFRVRYPDQFAGTRKPADVVFHISPGVVEIEHRGVIKC